MGLNTQQQSDLELHERFALHSGALEINPAAERNREMGLAAGDAVVASAGSMAGLLSKDKLDDVERQKKKTQEAYASAAEQQRQAMMEQLARDIEFYEGELGKAQSNYDQAKAKKDDLEPLQLLLQSGEYDPQNTEHRALVKEHGFDPDDLAVKDTVDEEYSELSNEVEYWAQKIDSYQAILDEKREQLQELRDNPEMSIEELSVAENKVNSVIDDIRNNMERDISQLPADMQTSIFMKKMGEVQQAVDSPRKEDLVKELKDLSDHVSDDVKEHLKQMPEVSDLIDKDNILSSADIAEPEPHAEKVVVQDLNVQATLSF